MGTWDKEYAAERLANIDWSLIPENARNFVMSYLLDSDAHTKVEVLLAEADRLNRKAKYTEGGYHEHTWKFVDNNDQNHKPMNVSQPDVYAELSHDDRFAAGSDNDLAGETAQHAIANLIGHWRDATVHNWQASPDAVRKDVDEAIDRLIIFRDAVALDLTLIFPASVGEGPPPYDAATATGMYDHI